MKVKNIFEKGQRICVFNPVSYYNMEHGEVLFYDTPTDKYIVRLDIGYVVTMPISNLIKQLSREELIELEKAQLMQIADLALQYNDREWFSDICKGLNKIK